MLMQSQEAWFPKLWFVVGEMGLSFHQGFVVRRHIVYAKNHSQRIDL